MSASERITAHTQDEGPSRARSARMARMRKLRPLLTFATTLVLGALQGAGCSGESPGPEGGSEGGPDGQRCEPSGGGPHWLLEGETVTFPVTCATGLALPDGAIEVGPLPDGATYDPVAREVTFSPGLDQAAVYEI
jgi:hypothetical protein